MNQTSYTILKLLFQQPLEEKELLKYLDINLLTLKKSILLINGELIKFDLPLIQKNEYFYNIKLDVSQKKIFYSSCTKYSQKQRCVYLTLKFLIKKKINLEYERNFLNISRATIDIDISIIKNILYEKKIFIISKKWKGLFLEIEDTNLYYEYICEILIVLYCEYKYIPGILKSFLISLQKYKIKNLINNFLNIYEEFDIQIGDISLQYFLALDICFNLFHKFYLSEVLRAIEKIKYKAEFKKIKKILISKYHLNHEYALYVSINIYNIIHKKFYLKKKFKSIIIVYCNYFNIILNSNYIYRLSLFIYFSTFRYKNNLYEVKNISLKSKLDNSIFEHLTFFLKVSDLNMLYGDVLELVEFTKFFLLENNKKTKKKILILKKDISVIFFLNLEKKYPNFIFDIKPYISLYFFEENIQTYDLILSDILLDLNLSIDYKLCQINTSLVSTIDEYLIEDMLRNLN